MRGLYWGLALVAGAAGCLEPLALDVPAGARAGARSVMWVWSEPAPTYWLQDLDGAPRLPLQRTSSVTGARASLYGCSADQLNLKLGLQAWNGCVPPTHRRYREDGGRMVPDSSDDLPECSPCQLWPLQVTTTLTLPDGYVGDAGLFLDDDTALVAAYQDRSNRGDLFRIDFDPPAVTLLRPASGIASPPHGPMLLDGERVLTIVGDEYVDALSVGRTDYQAVTLPLTTTGPVPAHGPAGALVADGDRLLWSNGFGALRSTTRTSTTGWRVIEKEWEFPLDRRNSIRSSMERLGDSSFIGVGVAADNSHYVSRFIEGQEVPYLRRYFTLRGDRLEHRQLPDGEEPVSVARTGRGLYLIDRRGAAYPIDDDGRLGLLRELADGSDLLFVVGGQDRLFYAGREGTFWSVFPESRAVCPAVSVAFGSVLITRGRRLLHNSGSQVVLGDIFLTPDCSLDPVAEEEP